MALNYNNLSEQDINTMTLSEAQEAVRVMAKRANTRLRAWENEGLTKASNAYRKIEEFSSKSGMREFMDYTKDDKPKFKTKLKNRTLNKLRSEIKQLNYFLNVSKTSTVSGAKDRYQRAYETFKYKYGTELSFDDFGEMWSMKNTERISNQFGSDQVAQINEFAKTKGLTDKELDNLLSEMYDEAYASKKEFSEMSLYNRIEEVGESKKAFGYSDYDDEHWEQ